MKEELRNALKNIQIEKMMTKNALESYRKMSLITGLEYEREINALLDKLLILDKLEKEIRKKM